MKITKITNNQSFNGLNLSKINAFDKEKFITPCLKQLKALSKEAEIELSSSALIQEFNNYKSIRPVINISVKPLNSLNSNIAAANYSMISNHNNPKNNTLINLIKNAVNILKNN